MRTHAMRITCAVCVALLAGLLAGCASSGSSNSPTTTPSPAEATPAAAASAPKNAECLVCKMNADLACIDVDVDKTTPSYTYNGHTYYFCSTECRDKFAKNPQKYLSTK
jgi:YHS domain-containing protein